MIRIEGLRPVNRHLTIVPHFREAKESTDVLLPDDYKEQESRYIRATVIDVSGDCADDFRQLKYSGEKNEIIVQRSMIEEVDIDDRTHYMILENYVMGIYRRPILNER